jgi:hypothetical protein
MVTKQVFSRPFNLVYEKDFPCVLLGPGIYADYINAKYSSPKEWVKSDISKIDENRSKQIFTFEKYSKDDALFPCPGLSEIQLITQSTQTTELEVTLKNGERRIIDNTSGINNSFFNIENLKIVENIHVPKVIDRVVSDPDLPATNGMITLYKKINDVYKIEQLLSVGLLGNKNKRTLVPTRWAITAVDDTLSKDMIQDIKHYQTIDKYELYTFEFYKNKFYIIIMPLPWSFEMIESNGGGEFSIDFEHYEGRRDYATNITGAYYASRLEIVNQLNERKRQGRILVLRDIDITYESKGVWVVREGIAEAMKKNAIIFETLDLLLKYINEELKIKNNIKYWTDKSTVLKENKMQRRLFEFI